MIPLLPTHRLVTISNVTDCTICKESFVRRRETRQRKRRTRSRRSRESLRTWRPHWEKGKRRVSEQVSVSAPKLAHKDRCRRELPALQLRTKLAKSAFVRSSWKEDINQVQLHQGRRSARTTNCTNRNRAYQVQQVQVGQSRQFRPARRQVQSSQSRQRVLQFRRLISIRSLAKERPRTGGTDRFGDVVDWKEPSALTKSIASQVQERTPSTKRANALADVAHLHLKLNDTGGRTRSGEASRVAPALSHLGCRGRGVRRS